MHGFIEGTVTDRHEWAQGLYTLHVDAATEPLKAGQFHNLGLPLGADFVRRSYSVASPPGARLEFFITRVEDGSLSPQIADLLPGDRVFVEPRPRGFFTLDYVPTVPELWLVATGTGLGPYLSMLRAGELFTRFERVVLVHGVRVAAHLAYADELQRLEAERGARFVRVPVVSREATAGALAGRVTTTLAAGTLEERAGCALSPERSHVMLCGNPAMIDELTTLLAARGLTRHRLKSPGNVTYEKYW